MAKINSKDLPLFIRTATRAELVKMMDIFMVAINDLDDRMGLKEGDTTEIHQTLTQLTTTLSNLDKLVTELSQGVNGNLTTLQALQSMNRNIYKLSDDQLEELKGISLDAIATLFDRLGYYVDDQDNIIESVVGDPRLTLEKGVPTGVVSYIQDLNTILQGVQAKALANEAALLTKSNDGHSHDDIYYTESEVDALLVGKSDVHTHPYRPDNWVPAWSEVTSKPAEFAPAAGSGYYRDASWVPNWGEVTDKPTFDWAKIYGDSGNQKIPAAYIPDKPPTVMYTVADQAAMLALSNVNQGDYCTLTDPDPDEVYIALVNNPSGIGDWLEFTPGVESVDGRIGTVTLTDLYAPISGSANYRSSSWVPGWGDITGKPATFNPAAHSHDDMYYTEAEVNTLLLGKENSHTHPYRPDTWVPTWADVAGKPTFNWAKIYQDSGNLAIPSSYLPPIAITDTQIAATEAAQEALTVQKGDICVRTDLNKSFIYIGAGNEAPATSTFAVDWQELRTPTDTVLSVDGQTGAVVLNAITDGDFGTNGLMKRTGLGTYAIIADASANWNLAHGWGDHSLVGYLEDTDFGSNGIMKRTASGVYGITPDNSASWDLAYAHSIADHAPVTADNTADNETSHADVLVDGQFAQAGYMVTDGEGNYSVDTETFLTEALYRAAELTGLSIATEKFNVLATDNILEALGKLEYRVNVNDSKPLGSAIDWAFVYAAAGDNKIPTAYLPSLAISSTHVAANLTAMNALTVQEGDVCVRTDENKSYIYTSGGTWQELLTPTDAVLSVDGNTGAIDLSGTYEAFGAVAAHNAGAVHTDTQLSNAEVIGMALTGFTPATGAETVVATDSIKAALQKLEFRVAANDLKNTADGSAAVADHETNYDHSNIGHAHPYRADDWVPSWSQVTSKPAGTDSDVNTSGATIIDNLYMTDGIITSHGTRTLTLADLASSLRTSSSSDPSTIWSWLESNNTIKVFKVNTVGYDSVDVLLGAWEEDQGGDLYNAFWVDGSAAAWNGTGEISEGIISGTWTRVYI